MSSSRWATSAISSDGDSRSLSPFWMFSLTGSSARGSLRAMISLAHCDWTADGQ